MYILSRCFLNVFCFCCFFAVHPSFLLSCVHLFGLQCGFVISSQPYMLLFTSFSFEKQSLKCIEREKCYNMKRYMVYLQTIIIKGDFLCLFLCGKFVFEW